MSQKVGAHRCHSSGVSNPRGGLQRTAPARGTHGVFGLAREAPDPWGQLQRPSQGSWAWRRGRGAPDTPGRVPQAGSGCEEHTQPEFTPPSPGRPAPHPGLSLHRAGGSRRLPLPSPPRPAASARLQGDCTFLHPREAESKRGADAPVPGTVSGCLGRAETPDCGAPPETLFCGISSNYWKRK